MSNNSKSIEELENDYWKEESEYPTDLIQKCFKYRKIEISKLSVEQIRFLISQKIGIEHLIQIALEKLEENIIVEGELYEGDLLDSVSKVSTKYWNENLKYYQTLKNIVESKKEIIKTELGEKEFDRINERIKASC